MMISMEQQLSKYQLHIQSHIKNGEETSPFWRSLIDMLVDLLQTSLSRILFRRLQGIHWDDPDWSPKFLLVCNPPPKEIQDSCEASLSSLARVEGACKVIKKCGGKGGAAEPLHFGKGYRRWNDRDTQACRITRLSCLRGDSGHAAPWVWTS